MIYLDRAETYKFIATIKEMLDSKASVLLKKYPIDEPFSKDELRKLAETLDIDSDQELLDEMEKEVIKTSRECNQKLLSAGNSAIKAVAKFSIGVNENFVHPIVKFASKLFTENKGDEFEFTKEEVEKFLESQKQTEQTEHDEEQNVQSQNQTELNTEKVQQDNQNKEDENSEQTNQQQTEQNKKEAEKKRSHHKSGIETTIDELHLNPVQKSNLMDAFENYLDYCAKTVELRLKESRRDFMKKLKENEEDFVNLLKLYIRLHRGNYENRNDFGGILVTESRYYETVDARNRIAREYFIKEIQRLDDEL